MMISTSVYIHTQNSTRIMQDEKAQTFRHLHICIMLADILALDYEGAHIYGVMDHTAHYDII